MTGIPSDWFAQPDDAGLVGHRWIPDCRGGLYRGVGDADGQVVEVNDRADANRFVGIRCPLCDDRSPTVDQQQDVHRNGMNEWWQVHLRCHLPYPIIERRQVSPIESEEARGFLAGIPTVGELVPGARLAELEASMTDDEDSDLD